MSQDSEAILVGPVVYYLAEEEDGNVLLSWGLGREEVVSLANQISAVSI